MKNLLTISLTVSCICLFTNSVFGQKRDIEGMIKNFNNFQRFTNTYQKDSALIAAENLANIDEKNLHDLLHDSFAQFFCKNPPTIKDSLFRYELLHLLAESKNLILANSVKPLVLWVKAKQTTKPEEINQIVQQITELHAKLPRHQSNQTERYSLLIQSIAKKYPECSAQADTLINQVLARLENLVTNDYYYFQEKKDNEERAFFRFLFASANYFKAQQLENSEKADNAEVFLQKASQWSPDESDRNESHGFFYENVFLFDSDEDEPIFNARYLEYLIKKGKKKEATQLLIEMAKADPNHIGILKEYYEKQQIGQLPFAEYWREILNSDRKDASPFRLTLLDGTSFDLSQHKGKWILIDFWGTWCAPCVKELPDMQKFYESIKTQNNVVLVTIACKDAEIKVRDFMQKKTYSFPVVMSDGNVEKMYPVDGYPTKILITPQGKQIRIEFGTDWVSRVNTYRKY